MVVLYLYISEVYIEVVKMIFLPYICQLNFLSVYTEYIANYRNFPNIGTLKNCFLKIIIMLTNPLKVQNSKSNFSCLCTVPLNLEEELLHVLAAYRRNMRNAAEDIYVSLFDSLQPRKSSALVFTTSNRLVNLEMRVVC